MKIITDLLPSNPGEFEQREIMLYCLLKRNSVMFFLLFVCLT